MKKRILILVSIVFLGIAAFTLFSCESKSGQTDHKGHDTVSKEKKLYQCPMHSAYTSDKPGNCPICSMKLVLVEPAEHDDHVPTHQGKDTASETGVNGYAAIKITPERGELIGVKTDVVAYRNLKKVIRASARIAYDTELYGAISEYKAALTAKEKIKESPWPDVHERADALISAAALRLRQMGLSETQLENIHNDYHDPKNLLLGEKGGSVWVYAQVYEYEAGLAKAGQKMEVTSPALPGKEFTGIIKAVDPILNSESRSLRVRAEVPNPDGLLKPEMYVNAKIFVSLGNKLAVSEEAVMNTGERQLVFVMTKEGEYVPRELKLGQEANGYYEVVSGVSKGERVVTSANFLIDSESKLKAAVSGGGHRH